MPGFNTHLVLFSTSLKVGCKTICPVSLDKLDLPRWTIPCFLKPRGKPTPALRAAGVGTLPSWEAKTSQFGIKKIYKYWVNHFKGLFQN